MRVWRGHATLNFKIAMPLSEEQQQILQSTQEGRNLLVTGSAGTGKSFLLRAMEELPGPELDITASTGIAAVNVGGRTIHSFLGIGRADGDPEELAMEVMVRGGKALRRIRDAQRIAIDEISMISAELIQKIDVVMRKVRDVNAPFGGVQMLFLGDFLQLPPVVKGGITDPDTPYFAFQARAWKDADVGLGLLTKVFRQEDETFSRVLNEARMGKLSPEAGRILKSRLGAEDLDPDHPPIIVHTRNADVDRENMAHLAAIEKPESTYYADDGGTDAAALKSIQDNCLAPETLILKEGARVMLLCNLEIKEGLANGTLGTVESISRENGPKVRFDNGITRYIEQHTWDIHERKVLLAWRKQLPLRLSWAITAHKSQGMTLNKIRVHLQNCFEFGQAYVALSRARTLEGLFIADSKAGVIRAHPAAVNFYSTATQINVSKPFTLA